MADEVKKAKLESVIEEELDEEEAVAVATPKRGRSRPGLRFCGGGDEQSPEL
jgi:hypothetical protein